MTIVDKINNYLFDKDYKLIITDRYINIVNYEEIINFSLNKIEVKCNKKIISIEGLNLTITKMLQEEVLITGNITNISINK